MIALQPDFYINSSNGIYEQLHKLITNGDINIVFQPIVSLRDGSVLGYEALSRGPIGTPLYEPDAMFKAAEEIDMLWDLELLCRTRALEEFCRNGRDILFINVNPRIIHDEKFKHGFTKEYLSRFDMNPEYIHFEISEKGAIEDLAAFKQTIEHYKKQNYKIAIDDAGVGYSGLSMIADVHPHYIKLDMKLVRDIDQDSYKKALIKSLNDFSKLAGIALIAEGIETEAELRTLIEIGVHFGQGYFIQRPAGTFMDIHKNVIESIRSINAEKNQIYCSVSDFHIGNLSRNNPTVFSDDLAEDVYNLFLNNDNLLGVTVVRGDGMVAGIITRTRIDQIMGGQFGYSLHAKRPIVQSMDDTPLVTDYQTPIDTVSKLAMSRPIGKLYDLIVVTLEGVYYGVVTIKDLLEKAMEIEVTNARLLNPLSGLPGNLVIESHIKNCVLNKTPFTVLYIDIDNFKAYNDKYGFGNGDRVISFVAKLMEELIPPGNFIGHVGGDDFVAVLNSADTDTETLCKLFIERFDSGVRAFYNSDDLTRGYVEAKNRKGEIDHFSLMTISVAGVSNCKRGFKDIRELSEYASTVKKNCKLIEQSCYLIN